MQNYYKHGDWNALCQVCGWKYKASELKKRWDGLIVCQYDWEARHPQDLIRTPPEKQTVPFVSREPPDTFITVDYIAESVGIQSNVVPAGTFSIPQDYVLQGYVDEEGYVTEEGVVS